jgi:hypothetical protein
MNGYSLYRKAWRFEGAPHEEKQLKEGDRKALLKEGGLLVRNTYDFDCQEETCFWYIIKDTYEGMEKLLSRTRNKIRHAQNSFEYRLVDLSVIKQKGYAILADAYSAYSVSDRTINESKFEHYLNECNQYSFDYWGIFDQSSLELIGFCLVKCWSNCCEYDLSGILTQYKHNASYPYYGLYYTLNQHYLQEKGYQYVSDGSRSITEHSQIHDFLIQNFNFRKAYCQLEVHYCWWMKVAITMLYPFRKIITLPRIKAILNMEAMQRGEK